MVSARGLLWPHCLEEDAEAVFSYWELSGRGVGSETKLFGRQVAHKPHGPLGL